MTDPDAPTSYTIAAVNAEVLRGRWYPEMPPALSGELIDAYTDRLTGADGTNRIPYDHRRFRQCSIGYHNECSDPRGVECECPCHRVFRPDPDPLFVEPDACTDPAAPREFGAAGAVRGLPGPGHRGGVEVTPTTRWMKLRSWLAGLAFRLAGVLDSTYDVWLDDAPPRRR